MTLYKPFYIWTYYREKENLKEIQHCQIDSVKFLQRRGLIVLRISSAGEFFDDIWNNSMAIWRCVSFPMLFLSYLATLPISNYWYRHTVISKQPLFRKSNDKLVYIFRKNAKYWTEFWERMLKPFFNPCAFFLWYSSAWAILCQINCCFAFRFWSAFIKSVFSLGKKHK